MADVLMISKPVGPPWNDSSKNLVRDLALGMTRHRAVVLTRRHEPVALGQARAEGIYAPGTAGFSPALRDNARVLLRLLTGERLDLWHFFFAPNPRTSRASAFASRLRRVPTVQTVCSAPRADADARRLLFADKTVVLSRHTETRLLEAGVPRGSLVRIPPPVPALTPPTDAARRATRVRLSLPLDAPLVLYPGDLELSEGASVAVDALAQLATRDAVLIMACRAKTAGARDAEARLREQAGRAGVQQRVLWVGETPRIHDLLAAVDVVVLPAENLYAKMDHPLVLLEAMALARPVVVAAGSPAAELAEGEGAVAVPARPDSVAEAVDALLADVEARAALGDRARRHVLAVHGIEAVARAHEALYDELLGARQRQNV